ncbi:MAG: glycosyltransferase family 2 protein [Myxococcota bacterium]
MRSVLKFLDRLHRDPVIIGGVGGSATRMVAGVIEEFGFALPGQKNRALDCLWFTLLFKRPDWFERFPSVRETDDAGWLLKQAFFLEDTELRRQPFESRARHLSERATRLGGVGIDDSVIESLVSGGYRPRGPWAFKEPNTLVFLPRLLRVFPNLKYIHVMRHPLDMALSDNQQQCRNWSKIFNLSVAQCPSPEDALEYWLRVHQWLRRWSRPLLAREKMLVVRVEDWWDSPARATEKLRRFLGTKDQLRLESTKSIRSPESRGRHTRALPGTFRRDQIQRIASEGYAPSTRKPAITLRANPSIPKLFMTMLVRDEEDILEPMIEYHLAQGVDHFVVTDNGSHDRTTAILERFERRGVLTLFFQPPSDFSQGEWVSKMTAWITDHCNASWIIHADADEFLVARGTSVGRWFSQRSTSENLVWLERHDFVCVRGAEPMRPDSARYRKATSLNFRGRPHRPQSGVKISQGNHRVIGLKPCVEASERLELFHYPLRSFSQFERKVRNTGSGYAANTKLSKTTSIRKRVWYEMLQNGTLAQEYKRQTVTDKELDDGLAAGTLLEDRLLVDRLAEAKNDPTTRSSVS